MASLYSGLYKVGFRTLLSRPGMMQAIFTKGYPFHVMWKAGGRFFAGKNTIYEKAMRVLMLSQKEASWFWRTRYFSYRFPMLNPALASITGMKATTCLTAYIAAYNRANYYMLSYLLSHSPDLVPNP
jgi:hypothetical protein